jgi:thiol-disulfide isomerase/thioredoxin
VPDLGNLLPRPLWVYVLAQYGCSACAEAEPHLWKLKALHPMQVIVVVLHVDMKAWNDVIDWSPKYTPGYALVERDGTEKKILKKAVGTMDYPTLARWIGLEPRT